MAPIQIDPTQLQDIGANVKGALVDGKLILVIDTARNLGPSSTGKMNGVANTSGFTSFPGGLKGNIYIGKAAR